MLTLEQNRRWDERQGKMPDASLTPEKIEAPNESKNRYWKTLKRGPFSLTTPQSPGKSSLQPNAGDG
jgi:hypothetical protein